MFSINSFLQSTAVQFSSKPGILLIITLIEWLCFLFYVRDRFPSLRGTNTNSSCLKTYAADAVLFFAMLLVHSRFLPISVHCVILLVLWTSFLCLRTGIEWHAAVFESSIFCLFLELGKSLFKTGTLALLIHKRLPSLPESSIILITFCIYLFYLFLLAVIFSRFPSRFSQLTFNSLETAGLLIPLLLYLFVRQYQSSPTVELPDNIYVVFDFVGFAIAACAVIVIIITSSMLAAQQSRNELLRERLLRDQAHKQYLIQKDALDAVNQKYHDLKHYLNALENIEGKDRQKDELRQFAREMREEIQPYETIRETGCEAMDTLLAQRILECQKKEIRFIPYVDGRSLNLLSVVDLCTLFGNAMDNAIEASMKLSDKSRREINVKIENYGSLIIMRFLNNCTGPVRVNGFSIPTSKPDPASHGFGLQSIRSIAARYDGSVSVSSSDQQFELVVMIPIPAKETPGAPSNSEG